MRIAYLLNRYAPGGLERCVAHLVNGLDSAKFVPSVISFRMLTEVPDWIDRDDVTISSLQKKRGNDIGLIYRLVRMFRRDKIDLAQSHNWATLVETSLACRIAGVVHVHAEHSQQERFSNSSRGSRRWLHGVARRAAFKRCAAVVACAHSVRQGIESEWGFPASRVACIANGVGRPSQAGLLDLRKDLGIPSTAFVVGSVGRLFALKGFDVLIHAAKRLVQEGIDVHVVLIGDGPEESRIRQLTDELAMQNNVHLTGYRKEIGDWLSVMNIYANASHTEAMSMSILEAMSMGLPVVATDVGDSRVLLESDEVCGTVVPAGDPTAMASALKQYILDPLLQQQHGEIATRKYSERYTLDTMVSNYQSLYMRVRANADCRAVT